MPPSSCSFTGSSMPRSMQARTDGRMGGGQGTSSRVSPELVVVVGGGVEAINEAHERLARVGPQPFIKENEKAVARGVDAEKWV